MRGTKVIERRRSDARVKSASARRADRGDEAGEPARSSWRFEPADRIAQLV